MLRKGRGCPQECHSLGVGNVMGCPGVFHGNPYLYPSKPIPIPLCMGSDRYGSWVGYNPWVSKPIWDQNTGSH
ncbi:hypothetical protein L208DRAFT_1269171 [Tricholoma matsutake]|nr:hypothetical protein L208DRAFT_1269171 [Tricholoma matsutake 945]